MVIEAIWFNKHPLRFLLWPLLWPLSCLFHLISQRRKQSFITGEKVRYKAPIPVIVVGNITAGGNGKTPMVIWLVEALQSLGHRPAVVSRGYGGHSSSYPVLVDQNTSTAQCGDEPKLIFQRTGAPVAVDPIRSRAIQALLASNIDCVITDDGLQHYALQRDIEIIVVDGGRRFGNQQLIPLGPLRESLSRLHDVDLVINNGGVCQPGELAMTLVPDIAVNLLDGERRTVASLSKLGALAGIGHPPRFFNTLTSIGAELVLTQSFADHKRYTEQEIDKLSQLVDNLIMTEKDAVKCRAFAKKNWWYLPVSAVFDEADEQRILTRIKEVLKEYGSSTA
jgi:tetraacyldisaccharide 4'-kinase